MVLMRKAGRSHAIMLLLSPVIPISRPVMIFSRSETCLQVLLTSLLFMTVNFAVVYSRHHRPSWHICSPLTSHLPTILMATSLTIQLARVILRQRHDYYSSHELENRKWPRRQKSTAKRQVYPRLLRDVALV
jgi:hypothetical protein